MAGAATCTKAEDPLTPDDDEEDVPGELAGAPAPSVNEVAPEAGDCCAIASMYLTKLVWLRTCVKA